MWMKNCSESLLGLVPAAYCPVARFGIQGTLPAAVGNRRLLTGVHRTATLPHLPCHLIVTWRWVLSALQISFGPISWLIVGEVFPLSVRGQATAVATLVNFGSNFGVCASCIPDLLRGCWPPVSTWCLVSAPL